MTHDIQEETCRKCCCSQCRNREKDQHTVGIGAIGFIALTMYLTYKAMTDPANFEVYTQYCFKHAGCIAHIFGNTIRHQQQSELIEITEKRFH